MKKTESKKKDCKNWGKQMKDLVALNLHMIVTIVDGGTGEDVIDFSKEAGAAGGTILHGRGSGVHDSGKFLGLDISARKRYCVDISTR